MTVFGPVRVARLAYRGRGMCALHPLDASLNLPEEKQSHGHRRRWVVLVDGDRNQIERLRAEAGRRGVAPVFVLDLMHVLQYLWDAAWCFFEEGDAAAETWVTEHALAILEGRSSAVAAGIRRSATLRGLRGNERKGADACADYLLAKRDMLHDDAYLQEGLPIAIEVVEGSCRHLINGRLEITGARWSVRGAEAVLRLRAVRSSSDFEAYWRFHLHREYLRHYASRYAAAASHEWSCTQLNPSRWEQAVEPNERRRRGRTTLAWRVCQWQADPVE